MRNILIGILYIASMTFLSCSDDSDGVRTFTNTIVGTWELTSVSDSELNPDKVYCLSFREDGKCYDTRLDVLANYNLNGSYLRIYNDTFFDNTYQVLTLNNTALTLKLVSGTSKTKDVIYSFKRINLYEYSSKTNNSRGGSERTSE